MIDRPELKTPPNRMHGCDECNHDMRTQQFGIELFELRIGADTHCLCDHHIKQLRAALKEIS